MKHLALSLILLSSLVACADIGNSSKGDNEETSIINNNNPNQSAGTPTENPICPPNNSIDGPGGFLWKPVSEKDGKLVVLFPNEYVKPFRIVFSVLPDGKSEVGVFDGFSNEDRQTYRFSMRGGEYIGHIIVEDMNQECNWFVPNPSDIQD